MATKFTVTHEINCDVDTFWKTFFSKEFNETLYTRELGFPEYKTIELNDTDREITRKIKGTPKMEVPGPVAKLLGSNFGYTEEGRFDKSSGVWTWKMIPSTMADKLFMGGVVRAEKVGDNKTRRVAEINIEAKVFGVGGMIESSSEKQMRDGWDKSAVFMNKYLAGAAR